MLFMWLGGWVHCYFYYYLKFSKDMFSTFLVWRNQNVNSNTPVLLFSLKHLCVQSVRKAGQKNKELSKVNTVTCLFKQRKSRGLYVSVQYSSLCFLKTRAWRPFLPFGQKLEGDICATFSRNPSHQVLLLHVNSVTFPSGQSYFGHCLC